MLAGLTPSVTSASPITTAPSLDPDLVYDLPLVRGQLDAAAAAGVGHVARRDESSWFDSTLAAAGTARACAYNHTAVPLVNGAADVAQAAGVGAVAGVAINVVAAAAIVGGATAAGTGAGNLIQHTRANDNRLLQEADAPKPGRGEAGDPIPDSIRPDAAGSTWEGRVAENRKGDVWQAPGKIDPGKGGPENMDTLRIEDPDWRYEYGCVRFDNSHGLPLTPEGRTGKAKHDETHIRIVKDGTFPVPRGWNPQ